MQAAATRKSVSGTSPGLPVGLQQAIGEQQDQTALGDILDQQELG